MDRALSFGVAADAYALARPGYPVDAVRACLPPGTRDVLDLGAGTGKLTAVALDLGLEVTAVEPDAAMRALVDPRAVVLAGSAEQVPLPDTSVDAVLVGQAWHWFSQPDAARECLRVLRPDGRLGLLWNLLDDSAGWAADLADLLQLEDRASSMDGVAPSVAGFSAWTRQVVENPQAADADLLVANAASRSTVILLPQQERLDLLAQVRALAPGRAFEVPCVTEAWVGTPS